MGRLFSFRTILGYMSREDKAKTKEKKQLGMPKPLPHLYPSFSVRIGPPINDLEDGIGEMFEECDAITENIPEATMIRDARPREMLRNWAATPLVTLHSVG